MTAFKLALAAGVAMMGVSAANANPITLSYSTDGGTTFTDFTAPTDGSASVSNFAITSGTTTYTVNFSATGSPTLVAPNFSSNTLSVKSSGAGTLMLRASEMGLTSNVGFFNLFFQVNPGSDFGATEIFTQRGVTLGSATLASGGSSTQLIVNPITDGSTYAVSERYNITFTGSGSLNANIIEKGVVPEPMSLALLGSGLVGFGLIRRKRS